MASASNPALPAVPDALKPLSDALAALGKVMTQMLPSTTGLGAAFEQMGKAFASATDSLGSSLGSIGGMFSGFAKALGSALSGDLKGAVMGALGSVGGLVSGLAGVGTSIGGMLNSVMGLGSQMASFVQLANPAAFQLFQNAIQDTLAVVGQALTPIFRVVTQVIRMAGDSLAGWAPQLGAIVGQLAQGLIPIFKVLFNVFGYVGQALTMVVAAAAPAIQAFEAIYTSLYQALEPALKLLSEVVGGALAQAMKWLSDALSHVTPYLVAFAQVLKDVFTSIAEQIKEFLALSGVTLPDFMKPKEGSSVNAAAKGTSIGSVESVIQEALKSAYGSGTATKDPALETSKMAAAIKDRADQIYNQIKGMPKEIADSIKEWALGPLNKFLTGMSKLFDPAWGGVFKDIEGPGVRGSGKSSGDSTVDEIAGWMYDYGSFLSRALDGSKGTAK